MKNFAILLLAITFLFGCKKDKENNASGDYTKGLFVVNQGKFQSGTGTITYVSEKDSITDLFTQQNAGHILGNIAQSMIKFGDYYLVAINNGSKVQVLNAKDFTHKGEINGIFVPRYFISSGDKLFVSSWGDDFKSGSIKRLDPVTLTIKSSIAIGGAAEYMLISNNLLYVTVATVAETSKSLLVFDINTNALVHNIQLSDNPHAMVLDKNNALWVICSGNPDFANPANNTPGRLIKLVNNNIVASYVLSHGANSLTTNANKDVLYFLMDNQVFAHPIGATAFQPESLFQGFFMTLEYDKNNQEILLADAGDFQSNGRIIRLNPITKTTKSFKAGIVPGFVYFSE